MKWPILATVTGLPPQFLTLVKTAAALGHSVVVTVDDSDVVSLVSIPKVDA